MGARGALQSAQNRIENEKSIGRPQKWLGLLEQLFPKDKWSHGWVNVLGKARQS